jgi:ELWxxDGT repeat protein
VAVAAGGTLFFRAAQPSSGLELWKSDGTADGTLLVKDIVPGPGGSSAVPHASVGGFVLFIALEPATGRELWRSDGTDAGTMVQEIVPGAGSPPVLGNAFLIAGDRAVFLADDGVHGTEPWAGDGFAVNLVADINPGPAASMTTVSNGFAGVFSGTASGLVILSADDGLHGVELWASDGQTAQLIADVAVGAASSFPWRSIAVGRNIFFGANDNKVGHELWAIGRSALHRAFNRGEPAAGEAADSSPAWFTADDMDTERSSQEDEPL